MTPAVDQALSCLIDSLDRASEAARALRCALGEQPKTNATLAPIVNGNEYIMPLQSDPMPARNRTSDRAEHVENAQLKLAAAETVLSHIPTEQEAIDYGAKYPGEIGRGIPPVIPAGFCQQYHHSKESKQTWFNQYGKLINWKIEMAGWWRNQFKTWTPRRIGMGSLPQVKSPAQQEREGIVRHAAMPDQPAKPAIVAKDAMSKMFKGI